MGHFYHPSPPTTDLDELEAILKRLNTKHFGDRFRVERLTEAPVGLKAKWGFFCNEPGWDDCFMAPALRNDGRMEIRMPPWGGDEVRKLHRAISATRKTGHV